MSRPLRRAGHVVLARLVELVVTVLGFIVVPTTRPVPQAGPICGIGVNPWSWFCARLTSSASWTWLTNGPRPRAGNNEPTRDHRRRATQTRISPPNCPTISCSRAMSGISSEGGGTVRA